MNAIFFDGRRLGPAIVLLLGALGASACTEEAPPGQEMLPVTAGTGATAGSAMQPAAGGGASGSSAGSSAGSAGSTGAAGRMGAADATPSAGTGAAAGGGAAGMVAAAGSGAAGSGTAGSGAAGSAAAGSGAAGTAAAAGMGGSTGAAGGGAGAAAGAGGAGGMAASGATFTEVYAIIMTGCGCHATGSGGLSTASKMAAYMNLVGVDSGACSGQKRVVAGDPANSVLMHALDQTMLGSCNVPAMPRNAAKLGQADLDKFRSWIQAGAMNN